LRLTEIFFAFAKWLQKQQLPFCSALGGAVVPVPAGLNLDKHKGTADNTLLGMIKLFFITKLFMDRNRRTY
jgi:hypothetical protein